jgi:hypothetical protein
MPTAAVRVGTAREERAFAHPTLAAQNRADGSCDETAHAQRHPARSAGKSGY